MATRLKTRNAILLAKIETTEGVDAAPVAASNAIYCSELSTDPLAGSEIDLDYIRGYLGASPSLRVEDYVTCSLTVDIAGTGTPGTAAPWGPLMRGCGFAETLHAAAVTGAAQAGTANTITLVAGASAVDDFYTGATISYTTGGTDFGTPRTIIAYNGTTKVATVNKDFGTNPAASSGYSIGARAVYLPVSTGFESLSFYYNLDGVRHKFFGARGEVSFQLSANQRPQMTYNYTGTFQPVVDAADTGPVFTDWQAPQTINTANTSLMLAGLQADGSATGVQAMKFDLAMNNAVKHRQLIGAAGVVLTDRKPTGNVSIEATTMAIKNWFADVQASAKAPLLIENGTVAGNTFSILLPNAQLATPKYSDSDGITMLDMSVRAIPLNGNDEVRIIVK